jgi:hypothetical protein
MESEPTYFEMMANLCHEIDHWVGRHGKAAVVVHTTTWDRMTRMAIRDGAISPTDSLLPDSVLENVRFLIEEHPRYEDALIIASME